MKLLFLCHRIPYPPDKGDKIRSYHELRYLAARHDVDLITTLDDPADQRHVASVSSMVRSATIVPLHRASAAVRAGVAVLTGGALTEAWFTPPALRTALRRALEREHYDAVLVFSSAHARPALASGVPTVLDFVDVDSAKWAAYAASCPAWSPRRSVYVLEAARMRSLESETCARAFATLVCAQREVEALRAIAAPRRLELVPNGTDTESFRPDAAVAREALVVFSGAMDYRANADAVIWFAERAWPTIRARVPQARLAIVGSNPGPAVQALAARDGIEVTGRVDRVQPWLQRARVAVAPLQVARGIQNKVLEALACATPVVATPAALEGIPGARGTMPAATPAELADAVVQLLTDPARAVRLGAEGRSFVLEASTWDSRLSRLDEVLREAASSRIAR
ncbi:MAG: TIGR03087 family PEP-CTERM/XrtA system glycosyltransferase [Planctomycetes bacterium]|nr:TIGR03087 family PEP-CTERM/XrtA system glycosyltransferase [Planctomycetota bacterium]MCC7172868.1 TIGR03087 family PEP-CTERM/XrtA system glycosyltransferase [Planctomycetota bacterium]